VCVPRDSVGYRVYAFEGYPARYLWCFDSLDEDGTKFD
jgi:hypothetical protein